MLITRPGLNLANMAKQLSTTVPVNPTGHSLTPGRNHPAFIQPRGPTHGQQEAAPAAFWFAAGASIWTERQNPALPLPAPAFHRPSPDRPPSAQPHHTCPAERNGLINRRRGWAEKRNGVGADRAAVPPPSPGFRARGRTPLPSWRLLPGCVAAHLAVDAWAAPRRPPARLRRPQCLRPSPRPVCPLLRPSERPPARCTPSCLTSEPKAAHTAPLRPPGQRMVARSLQTEACPRTPA